MSNLNISPNNITCSKEDFIQAEEFLVSGNAVPWHNRKVSKIVNIVRRLCFKYSINEVGNEDVYTNLINAIFLGEDQKLQLIAQKVSDIIIG